MTITSESLTKLVNQLDRDIYPAFTEPTKETIKEALVVLKKADIYTREIKQLMKGNIGQYLFNERITMELLKIKELDEL